MGQYSKACLVRITWGMGLRAEFRITEVAHALPRYLRSLWKRKGLGGLGATLYKRIPREKTVCMPNQAPCGWELHLNSKATIHRTAITQYPWSLLQKIPPFIGHSHAKEGIWLSCLPTLFALPFARHLLHMLLLCQLHLFPTSSCSLPLSSLLILSYRKEPGAIFFITYVTTQNIYFPLGSGMFLSQSRPSVLAYPISPNPPHPLNLILSV